MAEEINESKIGDGHAAAMFRQGLSELRGALYNESNVAQHPQYGLYGTPVPGEIAEARGGEVREQSAEPMSVVEDRLKTAELQPEPREPEPPAPDRG